MDYFRLNRPCGDNNNLGLSASYYPQQNLEYIGRTISIRFIDESDGTGIIRERNSIYEHQKPVFFVLRWDIELDGTVIMIDRKHRVVVASVADMISHLWYKKMRWDDIVFMYDGSMTEEEFNQQIYSVEKIYQYGQQDTSRLLYNIVSEYENDRFNGVSIVDRNRDRLDYEEIIRNVKISHPERESWPDVILRSYNSYHNEHALSKLDVPMRYINTGFVIRCDKFHTVVVEYDKNGNQRFITDKEAYFYIAPEVTFKTTWEELDLWPDPSTQS